MWPAGLNCIVSGPLRTRLTICVLKVHLYLSFSHENLCYGFMDEGLIPKLPQTVSSWQLGTMSSLFQSTPRTVPGTSKPLEYMTAFNPVLFGLVVKLMAGFVGR